MSKKQGKGKPVPQVLKPKGVESREAVGKT